MSVPQLGAILAAILAAEPSSTPQALAQNLRGEDVIAGLPAGELENLIEDALPPPPDRVVRETRYYGTVTINHRAHLARRARCVACHGPGPVRPIAFTPRVAHERCIGCHRAEERGPTDCKQCHIRKPVQPVQQVAVACPPAEPAKPPGPDPANLAAAFSAADHEDGTGFFGHEPFRRAVQAGVLAGRGVGFSVRFASHLDNVVVTQSVDALLSNSSGRTFGMLGVGVSRPIHSGVAAEGVALLGFDAVNRPLVTMLPAVGLRTGLEWRTRVPWLQFVGTSVTVVSDLSHRSSFGKEVGGTTVYGTVSTGFSIPPK